LPLAVFGSSSTYSIQRGYFHGPTAPFTCALSCSNRSRSSPASRWSRTT